MACMPFSFMAPLHSAFPFHFSRSWFAFLAFPAFSVSPSSQQFRGFHSSSILGKPNGFFVYLMGAITFLLFVLLFPSPSVVRESAVFNSVFSMDPANYWTEGHASGRSSQTLDSELQKNVSALPVFQCTSDETLKQAKSFEKNRNSWSNFQLGCAEPVRLESFLAQIWPLSKRPVTLVNIGANKGYNLVKWSETWAPQNGINSITWSTRLKEMYPEVYDKYNLCGTCGYCREDLFHNNHHKSFDLDEQTGKDHSLRIVGIEPSISNYGLLLLLQNWSSSSSLEMYNYASSNENGEAKFPVTRLGLTTASLADISRNSNQEFQVVRVITLDTLMSELSIPYIDLLLIDTEGYDPLVLKGAQNALTSGKISLIEFEYHGIGPWRGISLNDTLETLGGANYDCYLKLPDVLIRLTHCFHPAFEFHAWSNVLCVHRSHVLLSSFLISHCRWL